MNIPLARLISRLHDRPIDVMFHEVAYPYRPESGFRYRLLASAQRYMARTVADRADRIFVAALAWKPLLETIVRHPLNVEWLPVATNLPLDIPRSDVESLRSDMGGRKAFLFGHLGTYGESVTSYLTHSVPTLLRASDDRHCIMLGRGAVAFRSELVAADSALASRIHARENLDPVALTQHIRACDAMIQPFPDGVNGRRSSLMASIALGVPTITTSGRFTEPVWKSGNGVAISEATTESFTRVAEDVFRSPERLRHLGRAGLNLYRDNFAVEHIIAKLRAAPDSLLSES
jgi:glycosyltransferase involved in cell wall biosynthesis